MPSSGGARQILATLCVNLLSCTVGASMGWASSSMRFLESAESDLKTGALTPFESGVINSMFCVGGLLGSIVFITLVSRFGRLRVIRAITLPQLACFVLVLNADTSLEILLSRLLAGFAAGAVFVSLPAFVSEIATNKNSQTALGSVFTTALSFGLISSYILGAFMRYNATVWIYLLLPIIYIVVEPLVLESPTCLLKHNRAERAEESFMFYRGTTTMDDDLRGEFEQLKKLTKWGESDSKLKWSDFRTKIARKAIIIGVFMVALEQFSGCFAFLFNASSVFEGSGANYISVDAAVIIVGAAQLAGSHGATLVIDRIGRKPLLCIGCSGVAAGMASFGVATRYADDSTLLKVIPIAALAFSILMANATFFPLTSVILSEVAPSKVIHHIFALCTELSWLFGFVVFNLLCPLKELFGESGFVYFFAGYTFLSGILVLLIIPETRGKSKQEIAEMLS